jgi:membrane associated rhomboid family serine protease
MYVLYIFGEGVEDYFFQIKGESGRMIYLLFYLLSVIVSSIPSFEIRKNDVSYSSVGASGATSAIVFSSIIFAPWNRIYLMFIPIGIPAFIFGIIYLAYSYYMARKAQDNIAHDVHFFGALFGVIFTLFLDHGILPYFIESILSGG